MLLLATISCMMVANPGMPDSKKKKKKETAKDGRQNDAGSTGGSGSGDAA